MFLEITRVPCGLSERASTQRARLLTYSYMKRRMKKGCGSKNQTRLIPSVQSQVRSNHCRSRNPTHNAVSQPPSIIPLHSFPIPAQLPICCFPLPAQHFSQDPHSPVHFRPQVSQLARTRIVSVKDGVEERVCPHGRVHRLLPRPRRFRAGMVLPFELEETLAAVASVVPVVVVVGEVFCLLSVCVGGNIWWCFGRRGVG